ncbi:methylamine dehydrogenase (amicyanin) light chain [Altericroceibacterium spongiae]|uniref:Methylamine dehydrogenase (amicyanin) n=1 Tax=Altericroceibacterium spongiae TaxID=2320269 RepID=A0A420EQK1_9SPHN|nr:methylamine dehydrogenase light chain [Altericroceibacterium spongiae]RKF22953.1 methylamine dehydrogenase (amicyanin) light chain [Altericroceibacterium spongiae]
MSGMNSDSQTEKFVRKLARGSSRRSLLSRIGAALVAAPVFPLLPVDRANAAKDRSVQAKTSFARHAQTTDDTQCDYWRYCAIDGSLCTCCGGGLHTCPPGTEASPTSWIGTCINPDDGKAYLIAYRDCCGTADCGQCFCDNTDRATQVYRPQGNNDIIWCFGVSSMEYHCSTAVLVGAAE